MTRTLCAPAVLTLVALLGLSASASATPVNCPGAAEPTATRQFTLDTTPSASCLLYGSGNISGSGDAVNAAGWTTLDKSDDNTTGLHDGWLTITGQGTTSGTFSINPAAWLNYGSIAIGFKAGVNLDPDWAVFQIFSPALGGNWSISPNTGGALSHAVLYAKDPQTPPPSVPEPTSMVLLGSGLVGLATRLRKRA
jgi:hypothetical protein